MNPLFEAMSHVDDALIAEAEAPPKKQKRVYWISVAVSAATAAAVAGLLVMNAKRTPEIPLSPHNGIVSTQTDPTVTESTAAPTDIIDAPETEASSGSSVPVLTTVIPTTAPTTSPSTVPTTSPTTLPSTVPTAEPSSAAPTEPPATVPTSAPTTAEPTVPTVSPTASQTAVPSSEPTSEPASELLNSVAPTAVSDSPTAVNIITGPTTEPNTVDEPTSEPNTVTDPTTEPNIVTDPVFYIEFADFGEYRYELQEDVRVTPEMVGDALGFAMDGRQVFACRTDGNLILVRTGAEFLAYG